VKLLNIHEQEAFALLHHKGHLFKDLLLGVGILPSIGNGYEGHNKPL